MTKKIRTDEWHEEQEQMNIHFGHSGKGDNPKPCPCDRCKWKREHGK